MPIRELPAGALTTGTAFVTFEGNGLRLGQTIDMNRFHWPTGDLAIAKRWLILVRITVLSKDWPAAIDLRWVSGTRDLELVESAPRPSQNNRRSAAPPPGTRLSGPSPIPRPIITTPKNQHCLRPGLPRAGSKETLSGTNSSDRWV